MTGLMRGSELFFHTHEKLTALAICLALAKIPFLGPYIAAGAGVAAERNYESA